MSAYQVFEFVVIALIVAASAHRVLRQYAPASYRKLRVWLAARIGISLAAEPDAAPGCGSGCGTCATGCSTGTDDKKLEIPVEQPLRFHPRKN